MGTTKKQTAVGWLEEQIKKFHNWKLNPLYDENCFDEIELFKAIQQAKEMEKEQIIEAFLDDLTPSKQNIKEAEQYYNETYETN